MTEPFGWRLRRLTDERGPLCVGIDPHAALLDAWGLPDTAYGLERFTMTVVDALSDTVAMVKPQSAFFERHGSVGVAVLERAVAAARERGTLVLIDAKRGDIGSTAAAYAETYLAPSSPLSADAVTVSPYLGFGALRPFFDAASEHGRGVFVLALTSNPEGASVQLARSDRCAGPSPLSRGRTVAGDVLAALERANAGAQPLGSFGAVVGATIESTEEALEINGPLLAPGFGAQGGTVTDLRRVFRGALHLVVPTTSRAVLAAGPGPGALRARAEEIVASLAALC